MPEHRNKNFAFCFEPNIVYYLACQTTTIAYQPPLHSIHFLVCSSNLKFSIRIVNSVENALIYHFNCDKCVCVCVLVWVVQYASELVGFDAKARDTGNRQRWVNGKWTERETRRPSRKGESVCLWQLHYQRQICTQARQFPFIVERVGKVKNVCIYLLHSHTHNG